MIIKTRSPYLGKGKIWMKFKIEDLEFEEYFEIKLIGVQKNNAFFYEVEDDFPKEMLKLIFGAEASVARSDDYARKDRYFLDTKR